MRANPHLEERLKSAWDLTQMLARQRGLQEVYSVELYSVGREVDQALDSHRRADVQKAQNAVLAVKRLLLQTVAKSGDHQPITPGRAGRRKD